MRHRLYGGVRGRCCNAPLYSIEDKIYLFCTLKDLDFDDIHFHKDHRMTQIIISGKFEETGIAVYMENDSDELTMENLVLNERFSDLTD